MAMVSLKEECEKKENEADVEVKAEVVDKEVDVKKDDKEEITAKPKDAKTRKWERRMRFQPKDVILKKEEKHEYYKKLATDGQNIKVPEALFALRYASDYADEINSMMTAVKQHTTNRTALQCMPRHLRRRAASHNPKRLPHRLRELYQQQRLDSGGKASKTANRRKRRRHVCLQNEYAKRSGKQGWLETHLWHSKRFSMSDGTDARFESWGHRVALSPNDKSHRTSYRAVAKHCALQDISFLKCLEVAGKKIELCKMLKKFSQSSSKSITDVSVIESQQEINLYLYNKSIKPNQCIGPASVTWISGQCQASIVWIWIHPSILKTVLTLMDKFSIKHSLKISDISATLNRFRLVGPKSSVTLLSVLRSYDEDKVSTEISDEERSTIKVYVDEHKDEIEKQFSAFVSIMKDCHKLHFHESKGETKDICRDGMTLPLIVNDPRLTLPLQKTIPSFKATKESISSEDSSFKTLEDLHFSPLWDESLREEASSSRLPDNIVSTRKNELRFATESEKKANSGSHFTPVPILLVRRDRYQDLSLKPLINLDSSCDEDKDESATTRSTRTVHGGPPTGFGAGWDIILPANWAMAFWVPLIYHRAKAVGLKQQAHRSLECKVPQFPRDFPDTEAGKLWWKAEGERNHVEYYKKPPSKRPNMSVLASLFPFAPCWSYIFDDDTKVALGAITEDKDKQNIQPQILLEQGKPFVGQNVLVSDGISKTDESGEIDGVLSVEPSLKRPCDVTDEDADFPSKKARISDSPDSFRVLRDKKKLQYLYEVIVSESSESKMDTLKEFAASEKQTLICVKISSVNKGIPFPQSTLCVPTLEDISELYNSAHDLASKGLSECSGPVEPPHWDPFRKERKLATKEAKKNRKRSQAERTTVIKNQPLQFRVKPSRSIVGFVTSGDFLFSFASGGGIGFVSLEGLMSLYQMREEHTWMKPFMKDTLYSKGLLALMRNANCPQYRFVTLELVL